MIAWAVLAALFLLVVVLVSGRLSPTMAFPTWAGGFYLAGVISETELLQSYANPALAALVLLMLVSLALERAPVLEQLAGRLLEGGERGAVVRLSSSAALFSAFLNNTAVVGTLLGVVSSQGRHAPSRLLLPLSFGAILGGIVTLVGTSTNLVVNSFVVAAGLPPLQMFDFAWVGVPVALLCLATLAFSYRLLPVRRPVDGRAAQRYFLEARVVEGAPLIGRSIEQNRMRNLEGLFLTEILRQGRLLSPVGPDEVIEAGDLLIFTGEVDQVQVLERFEGLELFGHRADALLRANLVEAVIASGSELTNRTLKDLDFRSMFDAGVVAIRRGDRPMTGQLGRIPLREGDALLLATGPDFAQHRNIDRNFHVLGATPLRPRLSAGETRMALGGFAAVVLAAACQWLPLIAGLMVLIGVLVARGVLTFAEMRRRFPFDLILVIGSALALARALEASGAAGMLADAVAALTGGGGPWFALLGIYLLTVMLTEVISNAAAAALVFPLAIGTARALGVHELPFVMTLAYAASACFLTPFGYQTHLMVYSPGHYGMRDFLRAGLPVALVYGASVLLLVPLAFPFQ
ncbi:MAG: SLC13 family permease [Rhodocyclaceae bacterium]|nr:SLC13 family permease [Rhodocyclaceae bacterium]